MKKMLQNFGSILSILFAMCVIVIWQDFVIVWQNTPCTLCYPAMACLPHWCCWTVLLNGVMQHIFYKNGEILHACVHARRKCFSRGATSGFSKSLSREGQKWWNLFLPLETKKTPSLLKFSNAYPLPTPMLVCRIALCAGKCSFCDKL